MLTYRQMQRLAECPVVENGRFFDIDGSLMMDISSPCFRERIADDEDDYFDPQYPENYENYYDDDDEEEEP